MDLGYHPSSGGIAPVQNHGLGQAVLFVVYRFLKIFECSVGRNKNKNKKSAKGFFVKILDNSNGRRHKNIKNVLFFTKLCHL